MCFNCRQKVYEYFKMPFKKLKSGKYKSPSGRKYTKKQVALYYATDGFTKSSRKFKKKRGGRK